ncbi:MAG: YHYH protein [Verrucomicrobiales bacterium]|nr:YHYH protein [Verrucomicrobiales bacterium]MDP4791677.1 YHYH protein [Verrucomicrobiales bacterium]MDP4940300.1 YHYH protein [Verrucomicrobiales bacterium]MDP5005752.1 YHYH protein [Verrucomicrobiales bacterium]
MKEFRADGESLRISANGIPDHRVGRFPNRGNPHTISPQAYEYSVSNRPEVAGEITPLRLSPFGFALNGVFLDPGAAEFWMGRREGGWQYEALGGAVPLGLDENHAHVQPGGIYHYHGIPTLLLKRLGADDVSHSPQIGWAADGFPIYARIGYSDPRNPDAGVKTLVSSWQLKSGDRPAEPDGPGGTHDGTFVQDYTFVPGSGDLDECNGRFCITPEFPEGIYAYFLTDQWPVIPRAFRGTPVNIRGPGGPRR